jgi:hypothetical protein
MLENLLKTVAARAQLNLTTVATSGTVARKTTKRELMKVGKKAREVPKIVRLRKIPGSTALELSVVDILSSIAETPLVTPT